MSENSSFANSALWILSYILHKIDKFQLLNSFMQLFRFYKKTYKWQLFYYFHSSCNTYFFGEFNNLTRSFSSSLTNTLVNTISPVLSVWQATLVPAAWRSVRGLSVLSSWHIQTHLIGVEFALLAESWSVAELVTADSMASSFSIFSSLSIRPSESISSIICIDSVRLGVSAFRGDNMPPKN